MDRQRIGLVLKQSRWDKETGKSTPLPDRPVMVEVNVNWNKLALLLGPRAAKSKGKKATGLSGAVVVKLLEG